MKFSFEFTDVVDVSAEREAEHMRRLKVHGLGDARQDQHQGIVPSGAFPRHYRADGPACVSLSTSCYVRHDLDVDLAEAFDVVRGVGMVCDAIGVAPPSRTQILTHKWRILPEQLSPGC